MHIGHNLILNGITVRVKHVSKELLADQELHTLLNLADLRKEGLSGGGVGMQIAWRELPLLSAFVESLQALLEVMKQKKIVYIYF